MNYKAVIFDIDDTLVATTRCNARCRALALERLLLHMPGANAERATAVEGHLYKVFGWARMPDLWRAVALELGIRPPAADDVSDIQRMFELDFTAHLELLPQVDYTLKSLRDRGIATGIISDGHAGWQWRKLKAVGIEHYFSPDKVFISIQSDLHNCKPSTVNFRRLERSFGFLPDEMIYVGDKPWDVLAANVSGWTSVRTLQALEGHPNPWPDAALRIETPSRSVLNIAEILDMP